MKNVIAQTLSALTIGLAGISFVSITNTSWGYDYIATRLTQPPPVNGTAYDFIVIGAGSAGSVVAARLAEGGHSVLLLEAGGTPHFLQSVPALSSIFLTSPYAWDYDVKCKEGLCGAFKDHVIKFPRGRGLGGSSMLNAMIYVRGHSHDFDEWEALGNPGWAYKDVLPYFKKSEQFIGKPYINMTRYHGTIGRMMVETANYMYPIENIVTETMREAGHHTGDANGNLENGGFYDPAQLTTANGKRIGTYNSFVAPILQETDITVLTHAIVDRLQFDSSEQNVQGVSIQRFGQKLLYKAKKEVILSAGAIGSPHIMMLSGLGPEDHLKSHGIKGRNSSNCNTHFYIYTAL
jgi:choline dehydrogenase